MNKVLILLQIFCIVCANPVKRDGAKYQPTLRDFIQFDNTPVIIVQLPDTAEVEPKRTPDAPVEFPFDIAKTFDEIFHINRNAMKTEKPLSDFDTATCPNTDIDIRTEAATKKPKKFKKFNNDLKMDKKSTFEKKRQLTHSESESSVSFSLSSESLESEKITMDLLSLKSNEQHGKKFKSNRKNLLNDIPSDEKPGLYEESFVLKKVDGKPVEGTLTIEKLGGESSERTVLFGRDDGTSLEQRNLSKIEKLQEQQPRSKILDVLSSPYAFHTF